MVVNDAHCHFFSTAFFAALGRGLKDTNPEQAAVTALNRLGWDAPGTPEQLSDRWVDELNRHAVRRAALIASVPGDAGSVAHAVARHPDRFVGFFMVDPTQPDAAVGVASALEQRLRTFCLFPAMHRYAIQDERVQRVFEVAAARPGTVAFVHCGVLSIGARRKLGLPSAFDVRLGNPLDLHTLAGRFPSVPIVIPHFGAGFLREALMLADLCPNVFLDTSSSNGWIRYNPGLTLDTVFQQTLAVVGPDRLLFGTDSSFFPRGWVTGVRDQQLAVLERLGVSEEITVKIMGRNFDALFG